MYWLLDNMKELFVLKMFYKQLLLPIPSPRQKLNEEKTCITFSM